jgi:hypothetical protein
MSFDFDVDEMDPELECAEGNLEGAGLSDDASFEEIDFESLGIDPGAPTVAKPGSEEKVLMLAARYAAGVPLWHEKDCYDHSPSSLSRLIQKG